MRIGTGLLPIKTRIFANPLATAVTHVRPSRPSLPPSLHLPPHSLRLELPLPPLPPSSSYLLSTRFYSRFHPTQGHVYFLYDHLHLSLTPGKGATAQGPALRGHWRASARWMRGVFTASGARLWRQTCGRAGGQRTHAPPRVRLREMAQGSSSAGPGLNIVGALVHRGFIGCGLLHQ
jgi:hypothetical protein